MTYLPTRLRGHQVLRNMLADVSLTMSDFIYPVFLVEGEGVCVEIPSMKDQYHLSVDMLETFMSKWIASGIKSFLLFGVPSQKDSEADCAYHDQGVIQRGLRQIKALYPEVFLITDICLCQYKSDGHCCFFTDNGQINRPKTLERLNQIAISHVQAGADMIAPSDMMDGRIRSLRTALDGVGYEHIPILSYSAKYASSFYGPFREAAHSAPTVGDRKSYQMDYHRQDEAFVEFNLDIEEGADLLMVKPAMAYLDIIAKGAAQKQLPIVAYQVSGEYAMLDLAVREGLLEEKAIYEALIGIKRAGAKLIISYFAPRLQQMIERYRES